MSPASKVHRQRIRAGIEHRHPRLAFDIVLPFVSVRMPVHLPDAPGRIVTSAAATVVATLKLVLSATRSLPPWILFGGSRRSERIDERVGGASAVLATGGAVRGQIAGHRALEDPEILQRILAKASAGTPKFLASTSGGVWANQSVTRSVLNSLAWPSSKADHELAAVRAKSLQGMRHACRKIPEVALFDVGDVGPACGIEHRDATAAVGHDRPFRRLVPMQLADTAGGQPHVDARDVLEMAKSVCVTWRAQPPFWMRLGALLNDAQSIGMPPTSVAGGVCAEGNWLAESRALRARISEISRSFGVDGALRRLVRITERSGVRRGCNCTCSSDCQYIPSRKHRLRSSKNRLRVH